MRFLSSTSAVAFAAADLAGGSAPTVEPIAPETTGIVADVPAKPERSNVAAPKRNASKRTLSSKATGKPAKPAKQAAEKPAKAPFELLGTSSYTGASPVFRGHYRKLSAIRLDLAASAYTDRDNAALKALHAKFGTRAFKRSDADAGIIRRLASHGYLRHVNGQLDSADCTFAVTALAEKQRLGKTAAPKA